MEVFISNINISELLGELIWSGYCLIPKKVIDQKKSPVELPLKELLAYQLKYFCLEGASLLSLDRAFVRLTPAHWGDPLSDKGCEYTSSRFSFLNNDEKDLSVTNRVLYFAENMRTAFQERFPYQEDILAFSDEALPPVLYMANHCKIVINKVLDISNIQKCDAIGVNYSVLTDSFSHYNENNVPFVTQLIGRIATKAGFNGILYSSSKNSQGKNLVVLTENYKRDQIQILKREKFDVLSYYKGLQHL
jgi:hypothetical protein